MEGSRWSAAPGSIPSGTDAEPPTTRSTSWSTSWSVSWSPTTMRCVVALLVTVQVVQGWRSEAINALFVRSYWAVNYRYGFVRRGLGGEVLRQLVGTPSRLDADVAEWVVAVVAIVAVLLLVEALIRAATPATWAMALLLAASPFTFDYLSFQRRPDVVGIAVLAVFGLALAAPRRRSLVGLSVGTGLVLALLVLMHESVAFITVPWALVLLVVSAGGRGDGSTERGTWPAIAGLLVPPALTFAVVAAEGTASLTTVDRLHRDVAWIPEHAVTVLEFLSFDVGQTARIGNLVPGSYKVTTLITGGVLVVVQALCVWAWARAALVRRAVTSTPRLAGIGSVLGVAVGAVLLFRSGTDWLRWFAALGCGWLVTTGAVVLADARRARRPGAPSRVAVPVPLLAIAVVLVVLQPLPEVLAPDELHWLLWR